MQIEEYQTCPNCFLGEMKLGKCKTCGHETISEKTNRLRIPQFSKLNGRYMVGRILGSGGFGITYKAYDTYNRSYCAIKEFVPLGLVTRDMQGMEIYVTSSQNEEEFEHGKRRFMDEAEVLKELSALPEVVQITDYFQENNTAYFVMEYLEGVTLKQLMSSYGGRIPVNEAISIISRVGETLEQVHSRAHIFHRDISADNIMITSDGRVKLIDFGNAKYLIGKHSQSLSVVLKHGYAPPEQYSSTSSQGSYTDVYALAVTFYYITSGVMMVYAADRLGGDTYTPLEELNPQIDKYISEAVDKALVLNRKMRTQTVGEFINELTLTAKTRAYTETATDSYNHLSQVSGMPAADSQKKSTKQPFLLSRENGMQWDLPENVIVSIGRSASYSNIVVLNHGQISKLHCEIFYDSIENQFYIVDKSTNGTYIRNQRLEKGKVYVLQCGEKFSLGRNICMLEVGVEG